MEVKFFRGSAGVRYITAQQTHYIINYIDDLIGFGIPNTAYDNFIFLCNFMDKVCFTISAKIGES